MARLEYRLLDEERGFPVLYYYDHIERQEVAMRFACYYFVKERTVYERMSCAVEGDAYVMYVQPSKDEIPLVDAPLRVTWSGTRVEVRDFRDDAPYYPVVHTYDFKDAQEALLHLQSDYLMLNGREWKMSSTEIDEDRQLYVIYAQQVS